ncbi:hypothetical protein V1511DRAFT_485780 [Dipodascopsis uninucleata]
MQYQIAVNPVKPTKTNPKSLADMNGNGSSVSSSSLASVDSSGTQESTPRRKPKRLLKILFGSNGSATEQQPQKDTGNNQRDSSSSLSRMPLDALRVQPGGSGLDGQPATAIDYLNFDLMNASPSQIAIYQKRQSFGVMKAQAVMLERLEVAQIINLGHHGQPFNKHLVNLNGSSPKKQAQKQYELFTVILTGRTLVGFPANPESDSLPLWALVLSKGSVAYASDDILGEQYVLRVSDFPEPHQVNSSNNKAIQSHEHDKRRHNSAPTSLDGQAKQTLARRITSSLLTKRSTQVWGVEKQNNNSARQNANYHMPLIREEKIRSLYFVFKNPKDFLRVMELVRSEIKRCDTEADIQKRVPESQRLKMLDIVGFPKVIQGTDGSNELVSRRSPHDFSPSPGPSSNTFERPPRRPLETNESLSEPIMPTISKLSSGESDKLGDYLLRTRRESTTFAPFAVASLRSEIESINSAGEENGDADNSRYGYFMIGPSENSEVHAATEGAQRISDGSTLVGDYCRDNDNDSEISSSDFDDYLGYDFEEGRYRSLAKLMKLSPVGPIPQRPLPPLPTE